MWKIAIFCSVYNREKYIEKTLISVLNQTFNNFEFLIVDDWSSDKSYSILEKYSKIDNRIKCWKHENKWLIFEYNFLLSKTSKDVEYITWIDSDDEYVKDNLLFKLKAIDGFDAVVTNLQPINKIWHLLDFNNYYNDFFKYPLSIEKILVNLILKKNNLPISYGTIFIRKNILLEKWIINPTKNNKYSMWDFDLILRLFYENKTCILNKRLLLYRIHDWQDSYKKTNQTRKDLIEVIYFFYKKEYISRSVCYLLVKNIYN